MLLHSLNCSSRNYVVAGIIWEKNVMLSNEKIPDKHLLALTMKLAK